MYATATSRKGKNTGPGIPRTTAITSARTRMKTSATMKIFTLSQNAPSTEGLLPEPTSDCQRFCGLRNRSATTALPGESTTTTAITAKNSTVLALDTSTPRFPSAREPRVRGRSWGAGTSLCHATSSGWGRPGTAAGASSSASLEFRLLFIEVRASFTQPTSWLPFCSSIPNCSIARVLSRSRSSRQSRSRAGRPWSPGR